MIAGDRDQRRQEVEKQPGNSQRHENYNAVIPAVASSVLAGDSETNIEFLQLSGHSSTLRPNKNRASTEI